MLQWSSPSAFRLSSVEDYEPIVGPEMVERILHKADKLRDLHVVNVNSTYYGGGVAEILSSLTLLMNAAGIRTGWRVIQGRPDFFSITKKMHNALQGSDINLSDLKRGIYEEVVFENAVRMHLDHDLVIVHDPQPLPLIGHSRKRHLGVALPRRSVEPPSGAVICRLEKFALPGFRAPITRQLLDLGKAYQDNSSRADWVLFPA